MKEITDKLAHELKEKLDRLERFCDMKAKEGDFESNWLSASVMCHDIRTHLYWHMGDMIDHPGYMGDKPEQLTTSKLAERIRKEDRYTPKIHPCHTTTDAPGPCSWGSPSDPACTGCVKRG